MVVDNCLAHPNIQSKLESITLIFLPPNTTSKSQPCDQGIIQNLKVRYRKHLLLQFVTSIDAGKEFEHNLLDALYLLRLSWNNDKSSTLSGCFEHCGFTTQEDSPNQQSPVDETDNFDGEEARLLFSRIDDCFNVDDQVHTSQMLSD